MASIAVPPPAFGQATLADCEREQIHLAGSIQPHGALLVVREPDNVVVQASANAPAFLNLEAVMGRPLSELDGDLLLQVLPHLSGPLHTSPLTVRCHIGSPAQAFDCILHRPADGGLMLEFERAAPHASLTDAVETGIQRIIAASSLRALADETAAIFKEITGYDRAMVYRFDEEGHGEVFSERRRGDLEAFLGNRYPASDIPQIARRLYERNRMRLLVDVNYTPVPVQPRLSPFSGRDLDMSLSCLRSMSPIHQKYLQNMGVGATLVASLMVGNRLWGLIACHHYAPRFTPFGMRAVCEALAEACAIRIAALESLAQSQSELVVRRMEQRMIEAVSTHGDWRTALLDDSDALLQPLHATGAAVLFDGQIATIGEVPPTQRIHDLGIWFDRRRGTQGASSLLPDATAALSIDAPEFSDIRDGTSGAIAAPLSATPGEYILWFRPERIRTVTWGGDPLKAIVIGNDPLDLSPRRSFAQWHQQVERTSDPWTPADRAAARSIGSTVADVALQFRSVRMVIAQDQLLTVSRQVQQSPQAVVVADATGRILILNDAFERQMRTAHPHVNRLDELAVHFSNPAAFRTGLDTLVRLRQSWRAEAEIIGDGVRPVMVRADPVLALGNRALGFVLIFTDMSERHAAEAARARFADEIAARRPQATVRLDPKSTLVYQELMASVIENAQLAALEITHGTEIGQMPDMLDSIQASSDRTLDILRRALWHASEGRE